MLKKTIALLTLSSALTIPATLTPQQPAQASCAAPTTLTGTWQADDGGTYYIRQNGNEIWWLGMSKNNGQTWTNVFKGTRNGNTIVGTWADVPKGQIQSSGQLNLTLQLSPSGNAIYGFKKSYYTGGFGGSKWSKPCNDVILNPV